MQIHETSLTDFPELKTKDKNDAGKILIQNPLILLTYLACMGFGFTLRLSSWSHLCGFDTSQLPLRN